MTWTARREASALIGGAWRPTPGQDLVSRNPASPDDVLFSGATSVAHVDASAVGEQDADVEDDLLVVDQLAGDVGVEDVEAVDGLGEDGLEHVAQQLGPAGEQELEDDVEGGVEALHGERG